MHDARKTVFVLGLTSDIGRELGKRYLSRGWRVAGTYRHTPPPDGVFDPALLFRCDVTVPDDVRQLAKACRNAEVCWDVFIATVGTEEPIGPFFDCDFDAWEICISATALGLLRTLHALAPLRRHNTECACIFFSGAGTNNAAANYSAYSASKIFLIKMGELLAAENQDLNVVVIGPGIVATKIHQQTLAAGPERAGANYDKVVRFMESSAAGVSHDDLFECVNWCISTGSTVVGGRNISLVYDPWRDNGGALAAALQADPDMYRLRRSGNDWRPA